MIDKQLERLEEKIDKINDKLSTIDVTLARLTDSVIIHEKRTDLSEQRLETLKKELDVLNGYTKTVNIVYKIFIMLATSTIATLTFLKKFGIL